MQDVLLAMLGELVRKEISADQLLSRIVDAMAGALDADRATVFWLDRKNHELISVAGHFPEVAQIRVPITEGIAGFVARTGQTLNVPFSQAQVSVWRSVDKQTGYQTRTMLAGPILDGQEVVGVVQFLNKRTGFFTAEDEFRMSQMLAQAVTLLRQTTFPDQAARQPVVDLGTQFNRIVASGGAMEPVFRALRKAAPTEATVLIRGESGTGKTLLARAVHHNSRRAEGPFVVVDCTTLPEGLMENELFGHEKGAYTGADRAAPGKVAAAEAGTLFFDEIGDLPLTLQGKLLTLLQEKTYHRVGDHRPRQASIRVLAATNRDLEGLVETGKFREDLYWRLKVVVLEVPPLRSRGDVADLARHFLGQAARRHGRDVREISDEAMSVLVGHRWPGNVRELEHVIESAVIFCEGPTLLPADLPLNSRHRPVQEVWEGQPTLAEVERRYIAQVLKTQNGNRTQAAQILGIGRTTLLRKIVEYGLE